MYKINSDSYASVFVLPTVVADKHLRMAGKAQLKALLWLYRNSAREADISEISKETGIPADEIDDAMLYWIEAGLVTNEEGKQPSVHGAEAEKDKTEKPKTENINETESKPEDAGSVKPKKSPSKPITVKPSVKDISKRLSESHDIRNMFSEVQEIFGRTLGYDAQSSLLILYDHYALPSEVIIMLCNYASTIGKQGSLAYIMKIGADWAENEINTFDRAAEKIGRMEKVNTLWLKFRSLTGLANPKPTVRQSEYFEVWSSDYGFGAELIALAYERTVEKKGSISYGYMNGILRSWHESGFKTTEEVLRAEEEFAKGSEKKRAAFSNSRKQSEQDDKPSYDIEKAIRKSLSINPDKTKKGQ